MNATMEKPQTPQDQRVYITMRPLMFQDEAGWTALEPKLRLEGAGSTQDEAVDNLLQRARDMVGAAGDQEAKSEFLKQRGVEHHYTAEDGKTRWYAQIEVQLDLGEEPGPEH